MSRFKEIDYLKYTILRRAICYGKDKKIYNHSELKQLCYSIEGIGDTKELKKIHEEWIGY